MSYPLYPEQIPARTDCWECNGQSLTLSKTHAKTLPQQHRRSLVSSVWYIVDDDGDNEMDYDQVYAVKVFIRVENIILWNTLKMMLL